MDGFTAARAIRALEGKAGKVPIVALSAQSSEDFREQCLQAGMNDYLTKPYAEAALISVLSRWLPGSAIEMPPPLDTAKLGNNQRLSPEMIRLFLETTEASLEMLQTAWENRDPSLGKREAHSLRGSAALVAADGLFQGASQLETAFADASWAEAEMLIDDLQAEYLRLRHFLASQSDIQALD